MRALVYTAPRTLEIQELLRPVVRAGEVEVSVEYAGICGSDMTGFLGHSPRRKPPLVLGHELVGRLGNGERVVANPLISCGHCAMCLSGCQNLCDSWRLLGMDRTQGTYAEFVSLPKTQLISIPEELPVTRAILAEPLREYRSSLQACGSASIVSSSHYRGRNHGGTHFAAGETHRGARYTRRGRQCRTLAGIAAARCRSRSKCRYARRKERRGCGEPSRFRSRG